MELCLETYDLDDWDDITESELTLWIRANQRTLIMLAELMAEEPNSGRNGSTIMEYHTWIALSEEKTKPINLYWSSDNEITIEYFNADDKDTRELIFKVMDD